ncbi:MAG: UDP-N-acetylmuramoyl-L-alanine--D-glutamate ligase [Planctomycetaceae bacterium]|nr:UDP-N-acetylmuramoyl-L-alanine--D-glutamate ligase [Planctomycetaceae bacterium]
MTHRQARWLTTPPDWRGLRATVMGLGVFGGGEGATRFLAERGVQVTVTDHKQADALGPVVARIESLPDVRLRLGGHDLADFTDTDLLVVNPAVRRDSPYLLQAIEAGVPLTSEMNLFWLLHCGRTIGVTGSNGKSTTASLIHAMLEAAGLPARLGGNIGRSLLPEVENIRPSDWTVLELSSFQLADLDALQRSPEIAVVTNFAPNHQDHHASIDEYRSAKQAILRWQQPEDLAILNAQDADVAEWPTRARRQFFCENTHPTLTASPGLPGRHNRMNAAAAALAATAAGATLDAIQRAVGAFVGLPHRLQFVAEVDGRRFFNDSKSTTPEAAIAAIEAFPTSSIVLLAGGADKHVDLSAFAAAIRQRVKAVALLGQTAAALERLIGNGPRMYRAESLRAAFHWAVSHAAPGEVVLLSPGCASLDWFANYEDRGRQFTELARQYVSGRATA